MKRPLPEGPCFCARHTLGPTIYLRIERAKRDVHTRKWCGLWRDVQRDIQTVVDLCAPLRWPSKGTRPSGANKALSGPSLSPAPAPRRTA